VEHGADVKRNYSALYWVCYFGDEDLVKYLVEYGADVQRNKDALTA